MQSRLFRAALSAILALGLADGRTEARADDRSELSIANAAALRELLEGKSGRRETWKGAPELVVVASVMEFTTGDMTAGYVAIDEHLSEQERTALGADLTRALADLTGGQFKAFSAIRTETAEAGSTVKVFRPGQIVVGRFRGVREQTGSLGYGARMTRNGRINAGVVLVDRDFDRNASSQRLVLRTHELGHALGFNHVESRPSIMNPRVGAGLTEFDRTAIRLASFPLTGLRF